MVQSVSELLEESIKHWEEIVADPLNTPSGSVDCSLCRAFRVSLDSCYGCCIRKYTGKSGCRNTPYEAFDEYLFSAKSHHSGAVSNKRLLELKKLAQAELDFLISLRTPSPKEEN